MVAPDERRYLRNLVYLLIQGHHSRLLTLGDCTKEEIKKYFEERLLQDVPRNLRKNLEFSEIYDFFGGKLAHWSDYLTEYVNQDGNLTCKNPE